MSNNTEALIADLLRSAVRIGAEKWVSSNGEVTTEDYEADGVTYTDHICNCEVVNGESPRAEFIAKANPAVVMALIAALEQAQQSAEVAELLRDKVKRLESDIWDSQQLVKVKSENQYELECKVRELEERNDKSNIAWSRREDAALEKLEAAEKRIAELDAIRVAAEKLVRCKGRYHSEQNYRALAALFGVNTPDLPPLEGEASPLAVKLPPAWWVKQGGQSFLAYEKQMAIDAIRAAGGTVIEEE